MRRFSKKVQQVTHAPGSDFHVQIDHQATADAGRKPPPPPGQLIDTQLYNHSPPSLRPPPLTPYFHGFRTFLETMRTSADALAFTSDELRAAAAFTAVSLTPFCSEDHRQKADRDHRQKEKPHRQKEETHQPQKEKALAHLGLLDKPLVEGRQGGFWEKMHIDNAIILDGGFFMRVRGINYPMSFGAAQEEDGMVDEAMRAFVSAWSFPDVCAHVHPVVQ